MQQTRTHKTLTRRVEAKKSYSLVEGKRNIVCVMNAMMTLKATSLPLPDPKTYVY